MTSTTKLSIFFLFLLLLLPLAYSMSIQELLSSYDFSYTDNSVNITSINHFGRNTTSSLYDQLVINLTVETSQEASYTFIAALENHIAVSSSETVDLQAGKSNVQIIYDPKLLDNDLYNLSLTIYRDEDLVYDKQNIYSFNYNNENYEKPEINITDIIHEFIDNNSDSKYDILRINLTLASTITENANISVFLTGNDSVISKTEAFSLTESIISLDFSAAEIKSKRIESLTLYKAVIDDYSFQQDYQIDYSLNDLAAEDSMIVAVTDETAVDLNDNNLTDYLSLEISLDIKQEGIYTLQTSIYDLYDEFVTDISQQYQLTQGNQIVSLIINGTTIYSIKLNAPFRLTYLKLLREDQEIDNLKDAYITEDYPYDQFEIPPLADLEINLSQGSIITTNKGQIPAFNVIIDIYGDNELIEQKSLPVLSEDESYLHPIDIESYTVISAIVDFDNIIEESSEDNNFYYYDSEAGIEIFNISLEEGWNLISIPLNLSDNSVSAILQDINYQRIFAYDQNWFIPQLFDPYQGYWLYADNDQTLILEGYPLEEQFSFNYSKNLIGYPKTAPLDLESYEFTENLSIFYYNSSSKRWLSYNPEKPKNTLDALNPGQGYFLKKIS